MSAIGVPLGGGGIRQLTGDVLSGPGSGSQAATLSTVNASPGTYTYATVTVDGKGRVTAASSNTVDFGVAVILAPASSTRNIIQPTGDFKPLIVKRFNNAAVSNLLEVQDENGNLLSAFNSSGQLGLGAAPTTELTVYSTSNADPRGIMSAQYSDDTSAARIHLRKARGTIATPTTIVTGDILGRLRFSGYDGSNFLQMASIDAVSTGTIASTRVPTYIAFSAATNAAPSVLTEVFRLQTGSPTAQITNALSASIGLVVRGAASQSADLQEWQTSTPTTVGFVNSIGQASFSPVDATNNTTINTLVLGHNTSATPTAGYGTAIRIEGQSSTTQNRPMARIRTTWTTATDASRVANLIISVFDTSEHDVVTILPTGLVGIGMSPSQVLDISLNQDAITQLHINNTNNTASAGTSISLDGGGGTNITMFVTPSNSTYVVTAWRNAGIYASAAPTVYLAAYGASSVLKLQTGGTAASNVRLTIDQNGLFTVWDGGNIALGTTTGTQIGTATNQKLAFYGATPIVKVTTGIAAAAFVANSGTAVNDASTFAGYTLRQIAQALINYGLLT